jgi:DNA-directed RNA polymerase alpha subunit
MSVQKHFTKEEAKKIGEQLDIDWRLFDVEQFRMGMDVELEHGIHDPNTNVTGNDPLVTGKIALAHLNEFPDYYTRLEAMEEEAERYYAMKSKIDSAEAKVASEYSELIASVKPKLAVANVKLQQLSEAGNEQLSEAKAEVKRAWGDLQTAFERLTAKLK